MHQNESVQVTNVAEEQVLPKGSSTLCDPSSWVVGLPDVVCDLFSFFVSNFAF